MKTNQRLSDFRVMSGDQLQEELVKLKKEQFILRFQRATGQLENTAAMRKNRRQIGRINTLIRQREIAAAEAQETK